MKPQITEFKSLINNLSSLIDKTKREFYINANSTLTLLFWHVGSRILSYTLQDKRAEYGKEVIVTVSLELVSKFGKNYEEKNLRRMIQFSKVFDDYEKVVTLSQRLSWSHFITLLSIKNNQARTFYAQLSSRNLLSVRDLRKSIRNKIFERSENANLQISANTDLEKNIFKDPYFLDFLKLKDRYLEGDLESAIIGELQNFILELGNGFSFIERQKRMIIAGDDYYLDLLFYHRKLKRLIAIKLKINKFNAKYKANGIVFKMAQQVRKTRRRRTSYWANSLCNDQ